MLYYIISMPQSKVRLCFTLYLINSTTTLCYSVGLLLLVATFWYDGISGKVQAMQGAETELHIKIKSTTAFLHYNFLCRNKRTLKSLHFISNLRILIISILLAIGDVQNIVCHASVLSTSQFTCINSYKSGCE